MRVARVLIGSDIRAAMVDSASEAAHVQDAGVEVLDLLTGHTDPTTADERPLGELQLVAPIEPRSIRDFSVFERHIEGILMGQGAAVPDVWYRSPFSYFSNAGDVTGPDSEIALPPGCQDLDLELEVAAVIGHAGRNLTPEQAVDHIVGYTIFNDWSARDLQFAEMQLGLGICKGKDFANTIGPWIVTPDELEGFRVDDRFDLSLTAAVNGVALGVDTLARMAWSFAELVSYASRGTIVRPGDILGSGTCGSGCLIELRGRGNDLPWLSPGDTVALSVEGIGTLSNSIVAGVEPVPLPPARSARLSR